MFTAPAVDPIFQAISAAHWYALSGLLVSFALAALRANTAVLQKLLAWQQYAIGLAVTGGGAFVTAQATGHPLSYAMTAAAVAVLSAMAGLMPGVGHTTKEAVLASLGAEDKGSGK